MKDIHVKHGHPEVFCDCFGIPQPGVRPIHCLLKIMKMYIFCPFLIFKITGKVQTEDEAKRLWFQKILDVYTEYKFKAIGHFW